jgi:hypothetical protein
VFQPDEEGLTGAGKMLAVGGWSHRMSKPRWDCMCWQGIWRQG